MSVSIAEHIKDQRLIDVLTSILADITALIGSGGASKSLDVAGLVAATTAGKIKTVNTINFTIGGQLYTKGATDNLWDLTAAVDPAASNYAAFWLYLSTEGAASIVRGPDALSAAAAVLALPALDPTKAVVGVYASLVAQDMSVVDCTGTFYEGIPASRAALGVLSTVA